MGGLKQALRTGAALSALVACSFGALPLSAQSRTTWLLAAGISQPSGVFDAYADRGVAVAGAWEHAFGTHPFSLRIDLSYARNTDTTGVGFREATHIVTAMPSLVYHFLGARPHLYALVGLGYFDRRFTSEDPDDPSISDRQLGFQLGEGVTFRIREVTAFVEGRYVSAFGQQPLRFFPIVAGIRFGGPR